MRPHAMLPASAMHAFSVAVRAHIPTAFGVHRLRPLVSIGFLGRGVAFALYI